jgi:hypothetical protein
MKICKFRAKHILQHWLEIVVLTEGRVFALVGSIRTIPHRQLSRDSVDTLPIVAAERRRRRQRR